MGIVHECLLWILINLAPKITLASFSVSPKSLRKKLTLDFWIFLSLRELLDLLGDLEDTGLIYFRRTLAFPDILSLHPTRLVITLTFKGMDYFLSGQAAALQEAGQSGTA